MPSSERANQRERGGSTATPLERAAIDLHDMLWDGVIELSGYEPHTSRVIHTLNKLQRAIINSGFATHSYMPSKSEAQRRFMGAELQRKREGKKTQTGMSENQIRDFAKGPVKKAQKKG
jgi:hypothetical protein